MKTDKIFIAGHQGMVGAALCREFVNQGYRNLITCPKSELDLIDQNQVLYFLEMVRPDVVYIAVGKNPHYDALCADFFYQNLMIQANLIYGCWRVGVKRVFLLAGDYIYPKDAAKPMHESSLLTQALSPSTEFQAIAKIAGIKMLESYNRQYQTAYATFVSGDLYGPQANINSVVLNYLRQVHRAKIKQLKCLEISNANAVYQLLHVDDVAKACIFLLEKAVTSSLINIASPQTVTAKQLLTEIVSLLGYHGELVFLAEDQERATSYLDIQQLAALGWQPSIDLKQGLKLVYADCLEQGYFESDSLIAID